MNKAIALLMIAIYSSAHADDVLSSAKIAIPDIPVPDARYQQAVNKAVQAASMQSGFQGDLNKATEITMNKATAVATNVIGYTPFKPQHVFFAAGITYAALVKKEVTKSFRNPVLPNVTNTISVSDKGGAASGSLSWRFTW